MACQLQHAACSISHRRCVHVLQVMGVVCDLYFLLYMCCAIQRYELASRCSWHVATYICHMATSCMTCIKGYWVCTTIRLASVISPNQYFPAILGMCISSTAQVLPSSFLSALQTTYCHSVNGKFYELQGTCSVHNLVKGA